MLRLEIGDRVERIVIVGAPVTRGKHAYSPVRCDCGTEWQARRDSIRSGRIQSCGCLGREMRLRLNTRHGNTSRKRGHSATYMSWASMIQRCLNPKSRAYRYYGARGIAVCDRWRQFENFLADMGERPSGLSIERRDNNGNYEPGNCEWADHSAQMKNTRNTRLVSLRGEQMCVRDAAKRLGIPEHRIYWRVCKYKISHQAALDYALSRSNA